MAPLVQLTDIRKTYRGVAALDGVSLSVQPGEAFGIVGRSGAGKSTLLRCVNLLERPDAGAVLVAGAELLHLDSAGLRAARRRIGMVFQHFNLLARRNVAQNVALPLEIAGIGAAARAARVAELLALVGLEGRAAAYPAQLSGGQKQRVGIARALAAEPVMLLCDEATSALDPETTDSILALLRDIEARLGLTVVLITHEMRVIRAIADDVAVIEAGRLVEHGPATAVLTRPQAPATRALVDSLLPRLPAALRAVLRAEWAPGWRPVLCVDVLGAQARAPLLQQLAVATGASATLLQGGIEHIQDQPHGRLFVALDGAGADLGRRGVAALAGLAAAEVIGHVPGAA